MSIKYKLIMLLFAFAVLPSLVIGVVVFSHERASLVEVRLAQLNSIADLKKDKIETFFREREADLTSAMNFHIVRRYLPVLSSHVNERDHPSLEQAVADLNRQIKEFQKSYDYTNVMIANPEGVIVYSVDEAYGAGHLSTLFPDKALLREARKGVYFTDISRNGKTGRVELTSSGPVRDFKGKFIGYVIIVIDMEPIFAFIADSTGLGRTGESLIVRKEGDAVVFLSPLRHDPTSALSKSVSFDQKRAFPAQRAAKGETGSGMTMDYSGKEVLAAWRYLPSLRWGLVTKIETAEALQPVFDLRRHIIGAEIAILAGGALLALFFAARITGPILALRKGAEIIRGGNLDHRVSTGSEDEIGQLSRAFDDMTAELKRTIDRYRLSEEEVRRLNEDLKRHVAQLEAANKEMEAFSYSVSHDLRSPLRSIDGFSLALLEDYADKLDAEGRDSLERIRAATQRMGRLIDDLLKLSRVTRAEMKRERLDLSAIAANITGRLQKDHPERTVQFIVVADLVAYGDERLMTVALENLFANAWKFSENNPQTVIEFGVTRFQGAPAFFMKDNGAGFDMAYADKLFNAFQRLHRDTDFPGTGIGLATVKRIIERHDGRIWIEGKMNKGATVYFTLG